MNTRFIPAGFEIVPGAQASSPLRIVGVYADVPAHLLAMRVLREVTQQCATVCKLDSVWWSFDTLASPSVRDTAARVAVEADMIWCSTHACESLPEKVRAWVDAWAESRIASDAALVALLRCPPNYRVEHSPARAYLSQAAQAVGMELFVQRFDCACGASLNLSPSAPLQIRNQADEYHPDWQQIRHWGINE